MLQWRHSFFVFNLRAPQRFAAAPSRFARAARRSYFRSPGALRAWRPMRVWLVLANCPGCAHLITVRRCSRWHILRNYRNGDKASGCIAESAAGGLTPFAQDCYSRRVLQWGPQCKIPAAGNPLARSKQARSHLQKHLPAVVSISDSRGFYFLERQMAA
jgi:hypothetical protein